MKLPTEDDKLLPETNVSCVINETGDGNGKTKSSEGFVTHSMFDITSTLKHRLFSAIDNGDVPDVKHILSSDACISDTVLQKCIKLSIERKRRELLSTFLNHACWIIQQRDCKIIEVWSTYQKDREWEPIFVVLSADSYKGEYSSFLDIKLYKRKRSYISREAAAVLQCQKVKDNPLKLADYERLSSLYHKEHLFTKHSNITIISASPCRSRNMGQEIFIETCIVIHCLVKGFIPFDEEPFPERISGVPVDVREGYFTFGGKSDKPKRNKCAPFDSSLKGRMQSSTINRIGLGDKQLDYRHSENDISRINNHNKSCLSLQLNNTRQFVPNSNLSVNQTHLQRQVLPEVERSQSEPALYQLDSCRMISDYSYRQTIGNMCQTEENNLEISPPHPNYKAEELLTHTLHGDSSTYNNLCKETKYSGMCYTAATIPGVQTPISSRNTAVFHRPSNKKGTCASYLNTNQSDAESSKPDAAQEQSNFMEWRESYCDINETVPSNPQSRLETLDVEEKLAEDFESKCALKVVKRTKCRETFCSGRVLSGSSVSLPDEVFAPLSYTKPQLGSYSKSSRSEQLISKHLSGRLISSVMNRTEKGGICEITTNNNQCYFEEERESEESKDRRNPLLGKPKSYLEDDKTLYKKSTNTSSASSIRYDEMSNVCVADGDGPLEFNEILLMGTGIGLSGSSLRGTLGGFVHHEDGTLCFITCAHVIGHESGVADENINYLICQPADADIQPKRRFKPENADPQTQRQFKRTVCGHVYKAVFDPGNGDSVSVDTALVAVDSRRPNRAEFRWVRDDQLMDSGFDPSSPPQFMKGNILTYENLKKQENGLKDVIKIGAETGLSKGSIVMVGTDVRKLNKKQITMKTPNDKPATFYRQIEISPDEGVSFFDLGDSGSLVFMQIGSELYCIGMAIGITHPQRTCIVTPIESVLEKLGLPEDTKFVDFTDNIE